MRTKRGPFPQQLLQLHKKARPQQGSSEGASRTGDGPSGQQHRQQLRDVAPHWSSRRCKLTVSCHLIFPVDTAFTKWQWVGEASGEKPLLHMWRLNAFNHFGGQFVIISKCLKMPTYPKEQDSSKGTFTDVSLLEVKAMQASSRRGLVRWSTLHPRGRFLWPLPPSAPGRLECQGESSVTGSQTERTLSGTKRSKPPTCTTTRTNLKTIVPSGAQSCVSWECMHEAGTTTGCRGWGRVGTDGDRENSGGAVGKFYILLLVVGTGHLSCD